METDEANHKFFYDLFWRRPMWNSERHLTSSTFNTYFSQSRRQTSDVTFADKWAAHILFTT